MPHLPPQRSSAVNEKDFTRGRDFALAPSTFLRRCTLILAERLGSWELDRATYLVWAWKLERLESSHFWRKRNGSGLFVSRRTTNRWSQSRIETEGYWGS